MTEPKRQWRLFRKNKAKTSARTTKGGNSGVPVDDNRSNSRKNEPNQRRSVGGLFARARKKKIVVTAPVVVNKKNAVKGAVIIPSRSFEGTEETSGSPRREFKVADELKEIQLNKVGNSIETHQDSVSSAQEESLSGDISDHHHQTATTPQTVQTPPRREKDVNETVLSKSNLGGITLDDLNRMDQVKTHVKEVIPEILSQVESEAQTQKICGSPGRSKQSNSRLDEQPEPTILESTPSHDPLMPSEVVLGGVPACGTHEELTVFSEDTDDREMGISTPPALRRTRSKAQTDIEPASNAVRASNEELQTRSFDHVNENSATRNDRTVKRMELETLKKQLQDEKVRIKQQIADEDAKLPAKSPAKAEVSAENRPLPDNEVDENAFSVIDWDVLGETKPIATTPPRKKSFDFTAKTDGSTNATGNFGFANFEENMHQKTEETAAPRSDVVSSVPGPPSVAPSSTTATESFFRFRSAMISEFAGPEQVKPESDNSEPIEKMESLAPVAPDHEREVTALRLGGSRDGVEDLFRAPRIKRTTSDGSLGLETGSCIKRSDSKGSVGVPDVFLLAKSQTAPDPPTDELTAEQPIEISRSSSADEIVQVKDPFKIDGATKISASDEAKKMKKRRSRRRQRTRETVPDPNDADAEKDYKVRLVENEQTSRFGGVEVEHLPEDTFEAQSQGSGCSRDMTGSRHSACSGSDDDSHYDSDPDPFSGIEEARLAALTLALKNAREAVANKTGETDALVNDTTFSKRPGRVRFQRKAFFKRLKQGRDKKSTPSKSATEVKVSSSKVTRKGKMAPQEIQDTVKAAATRIALSKMGPPPPMPPSDTEIQQAESFGENQLFSSSFFPKAAADSDIEVNMNRASPNNILRNVSVVEEERVTVVSDDGEDELHSDASSWDDGSQEELSDDSSSDGLLMSVAKTFTRTITWGTGLGLPSHPSISEHRSMSDGFMSDGALSDAPMSDGITSEGTFDEDNLVVNRSFSFSASRNEDDDDTATYSDEETIRSEDVLALRGRFACM